MRFQASIQLQGDPPVKIPVQYRKNLMSLIKESLKSDNSQGDLFSQFYGEKAKNQPKPFTFSVQLPVKDREKTKSCNCFVLAQNQFHLFFSACDQVFLIHVYNGLVNLKKSYTLFPGLHATIRGFALQKEQKIESEEMVFKTFSPFLVRDIQNKKGKGFLSFEQEGFEWQLLHTVQNLCQNFIDKNYELSTANFEFTPVKCKATPVPLYGNEIGNSGIFRLKAPVEVLQLIYDAGLGAKRSQGFGMLEVMG